MIIARLSKMVAENQDKNPLYLRNLLKQELQALVLNFIYSSEYNQSFLLKGGTCLRFCFDLPRLSEDLDFDIENHRHFSLGKLTTQLESYFKKDLQIKNFYLKTAGNQRQVYLKFPLLDEIGLIKTKSETNVLFLRIDLSEALGKSYQKDISFKSVGIFSFIIHRYSLADLMSGKILALLQREVGKKGEARVKGRDYFDLIWFLERKVRPNFEYLKEISRFKSKKEIWRRLDEKVENLDLKVFKDDLLPLFADQEFVSQLVKNFKNLYQSLRGDGKEHFSAKAQKILD